MKKSILSKWVDTVNGPNNHGNEYVHAYVDIDTSHVSQNVNGLNSLSEETCRVQHMLGDVTSPKRIVRFDLNLTPEQQSKEGNYPLSMISQNKIPAMPVPSGQRVFSSYMVKGKMAENEESTNSEPEKDTNSGKTPLMLEENLESPSKMANEASPKNDALAIGNENCLSRPGSKRKFQMLEDLASFCSKEAEALSRKRYVSLGYDLNLLPSQQCEEKETSLPKTSIHNVPMTSDICGDKRASCSYVNEGKMIEKEDFSILTMGGAEVRSETQAEDAQLTLPQQSCGSGNGDLEESSIAEILTSLRYRAGQLTISNGVPSENGGVPRPVVPDPSAVAMRPRVQDAPETDGISEA